MTEKYGNKDKIFCAKEGDASIGLPPYNGGLFASRAAGLLEQVRLPDASIAPLIYQPKHTHDERSGLRRFVNYRDMSVQQLGSIYLFLKPTRQPYSATAPTQPRRGQ